MGFTKRVLILIGKPVGISLTYLNELICLLRYRDLNPNTLGYEPSKLPITLYRDVGSKPLVTTGLDSQVTFAAIANIQLCPKSPNLFCRISFNNCIIGYVTHYNRTSAYRAIRAYFNSVLNTSAYTYQRALSYCYIARY